MTNGYPCFDSPVTLTTMSQDQQAGLGEKANVATAFGAMEAKGNVYKAMKNHHVSWLNPCESTKNGHFMVNVYIPMENDHFFMGKVIFSVAIFSGYVPNFQMVPQNRMLSECSCGFPRVKGLC